MYTAPFPWPPPAPASPTPEPTLRWWRRGWAGAAAVALIVGSLAFDRSTLGLVLLVFVLVVPFERWFPRHRQPFRRPALGTDVAFALSSSLVSVAGLAVAVVVSVLSLAWLPGLALRPLVALLPGWAQSVAGVLLFDLTVYWAHRFGHEVPAGWRFHKVHHSTRHLDWVSGFRSHPFDGLLLAPAFVLLLAAGFSPELTGVLVVLQVVTGLFLHANVRWRWRPLHRLFITPEFHHWHHSNEPEAHCSNYSVMLPVWDLLFGTYFMPSDRRPQRYGIDEPVPDTMVAQLLEPLRGLPRPWTVARHPWRSARQGWRWMGVVRRQMWASATRRRPRPAA